MIFMTIIQKGISKQSTWNATARINKIWHLVTLNGDKRTIYVTIQMLPQVLHMPNVCIKSELTYMYIMCNNLVERQHKPEFWFHDSILLPVCHDDSIWKSIVSSFGLWLLMLHSFKMFYVYLFHRPHYSDQSWCFCHSYTFTFWS